MVANTSQIYRPRSFGYEPQNLHRPDNQSLSLTFCGHSQTTSNIKHVLALFRTNQFVANILLLLYAVIVRGSVFMQSDPVALSQPGIFSKLLYQWVPPYNIEGFVVATILVFIQAVIINIVVGKNRIANEISLLPGMFYVLLSSAFSEFLHLSPLILANTFYIIILMELFSTYRKYSAAGAIFNIGLWTGVASLFYASYLFLFLLGMAGLAILRSFKLKEQLMAICGLLTPYILTGTYFFLTDNFSEFWQEQMQDNFGFLDLEGTPDLIFYLKMGLLGLMLLTFIFSYNNYTKKKNIQQQKYINVLFTGLLLSTLPLLFQANIHLDHLLILVPAAGILLSFNFQNARASIAESAHLLLLIGLLVLQFSFYW